MIDHTTELIEKVYNIVSTEFGTEFKSKTKTREKVIPRDLFVCLCIDLIKEDPNRLYGKIATVVNRDRTSIIAAYKRKESIFFNEKGTAELYISLFSKLTDDSKKLITLLNKEEVESVENKIKYLNRLIGIQRQTLIKLKS